MPCRVGAKLAYMKVNLGDPPLTDAVFAHEPSLRLAAFAGVLVLLIGWELFAPRRVQATGRWRRWPSNLGIVALDTLIVRLAFPAAAVGMALVAGREGWGLLNAVGWPGWARVLVAIVALDFVIWAQHIAFHHVPWLWRLHRVHHADVELDVTTGLRFHPAEILLSMAIKIATVAALGAPALAVLAFEVLLNATTMFNHANIRMPEAVDRVLRRVLVTPDMHRIHHSAERTETNSNYGFSLPIWDRMFGTYRADAAAGQLGLKIGLAEFRDPEELRLDRMLVQPLRRDEI